MMQLSRRQYRFGPHALAAGPAAAEAPYLIAGPRLYAIGRASGELSPIGAEHLVGEMGGIWAHPVKVAEGMTVHLRDRSGVQLAGEDGQFNESPAEVGWSWRCGELMLSRRDRVLPGGPAYAALVTVANQGSTTATGALEVAAQLGFRGCWFGGLPSDGGAFRLADALVLGQDGLQSTWGLALGAAALPTTGSIEPREHGAMASLSYEFTLEPGAVRAWLILLAVGQQGGASEAEALWHSLIDRAEAAFGDDPAEILAGLPSLDAAEPDLTRDFALAQANLRLLEADYPDTGPYFLAGLPEYPQLFGCDTAYTVPGAVAAGYASTCRSALVTLARYAERACGRVPHEITTNGRVFNPGNIQETPQLAIAVWDYVRWTGDVRLAESLFPILREGLLDYLPAVGGPDPRYPFGDGMVERLGMGSRKLDSACYTIAGLRALGRLAAALGDPAADGYAARADAYNRDFEADWWLEGEGLYADSMHSDGRLQLDGHWTAVLPVQLGLAAPERARRVLERIEAEFVNQWGLVHTRAREEAVWTLPTGLLALAAFRHGRAERGLQLARNIALTAQHGALGAFKELIPQGLCFVQLWSAGLYLQSILEGLLGLDPVAPAHRLAIAPVMPQDMGPVTLRGLSVGPHVLNLTIAPRALRLEHREGPQPLTVVFADTEVAVATAETVEL
jgi:hypothetical protein